MTLTRQLKLEEDRIEDQLRSNAQRQETSKRNIKLTEEILQRLKASRVCRRHKRGAGPAGSQSTRDLSEMS